MSRFFLILVTLISSELFAETSLSCANYFEVLNANYLRRKNTPIYKKNEEVIRLNSELAILNGIKKIKNYVDKELFGQFREKNGENLDHIVNSLQQEVLDQKTIFDLESGCKVEVGEDHECPKAQKKYDANLNPVVSFAQTYKASGFFDTLFDNNEDIFKKFKEYLVTQCSTIPSDTKAMQLQSKIRKNFFNEIKANDCKSALAENRLKTQKEFILSLFNLAKNQSEEGKESLTDKQLGYYEELASVQNSISYYQMQLKGLNQKHAKSKSRNGSYPDSYFKELSELTRAARVNLNANIDLTDKATDKFNVSMKRLDPLWPTDEETQYRYLNYKWNFDKGEEADKNRAYLGKVGALFSEMVYGFQQFKSYTHENLPYEMEKLLKDLSPSDYQKCDSLKLTDIETNFTRKHVSFISKLFTCMGAISPNGLQAKIDETTASLKKSESELKTILSSELSEDYKNAEDLGQQMVELIQKYGCENREDDSFVSIGMPCVKLSDYKSSAVNLLYKNQKKVIRFIYPYSWQEETDRLFEVEKSSAKGNPRLNPLIDELDLPDKIKTALKNQIH